MPWTRVASGTALESQRAGMPGHPQVRFWFFRPREASCPFQSMIHGGILLPARNLNNRVNNVFERDVVYGLSG
jgi:hypothetical protein